MGLDLVPDEIHERFELHERHHACAILASDCQEQFADLIACLNGFQLLRSEIIRPGGSKTLIVQRLENLFAERGWEAQNTNVRMMIGDSVHSAKTHEIDLCKGRVACEMQWNSKDGVFSRDLGTFRVLHEWDLISAGIIITRCDELQEIFDGLGWVKDKTDNWQRVGGKYGMSTTHLSKVRTRIDSRDAGMCPLLIIGIRPNCYIDDLPDVQPILQRPKPSAP
jgi:hypothetical protein